MKKMRTIIYLLFIFLLGNNQAWSQIKFPSHIDYWEIEGMPSVTKIDTITNVYIAKTDQEQGNLYYVDHNLIYSYNDSSIRYDFQTEFGLMINNKRFGNWMILKGEFQNGIRETYNENSEYYINDFLIPDAQNFSDSITIDYINRKMFCYFTFSYGLKDTLSIPMKVMYWIDVDSNKTMAKCLTLNDKLIFKETAVATESALIELFSGFYHYKLYVP